MKYRLMSLVSIIFGTMLLISFAADLVVFYDSLVIFDTMGAAELEPLKVESGDTVSLPTPQREGYTFEGWFLDDAFESSASFLILSNQDRTLYAKWDPIPYTLVFNTNGGSSVDAITEFFDTELDITLPEKAGYNFTGWFEDNQTFLVPFTSTTMTLDKTLFAKWTPIEFNVSYTLNGGENNASNVLTYTIEDDLVNFLAPDKVGYSFLGWFENSAFEGNPITAINPNRLANVSLFAKFAINTYTLTFDTRGGNSITRLEQDFETTVETPVEPTREGHTFAGWFADVDATTPYTFTTMPIGNITVYANWTRNTYNITLDSNGGSALSQTTFTYGFGDELDLPKPTLLGYNFVGWQATGTEVIYNNGNIMPARNLTLEAQWVEKMYPVVYYIFEQDVTNPDILPQTREYKLGEQVTAATITNPGYTFDGWFDSVTKEPFGFGFTMPDAQAPYVIFGKWTAIVYSVTYNLNNGVNSPENPVEFTVEDSIPLKAPDRSGFEFQGWDSESVTVSNVGGTVTDLVLTARWTLKQFDITYDLGGEGANNNFDNLRTYNIETVFTFLAPSRTGYEFDGWVDTATNEKITGIIAGTSGPLSVKATWILRGYVLTVTSIPDSEPDVTVLLQDQAISLTTPTRAGYTFGGWREVGNQTVWTNGQSMPNKNVTINAVWTLVNYNIAYNGNGITTLPTGLPTIYNITSNITITKPTRLGWIFLGWDYNNDGTHDFTDGFDSGTYLQNLELKAIWTQKPHTLTFDADGGVPVDEKEFFYDQATSGLFGAPENREPLGYRFRGWIGPDGHNWTNNPGNRKMPDNSITVKAQWELISYNITYSAGYEGALGTYSTTANVEIKVYIGFTPVRPGYTFTGWKATQDDLIYTADTQMPPKDLDLVAQWQPNS
jgi:uncharacterized repeat protein (TIGR02543 family)